MRNYTGKRQCKEEDINYGTIKTVASRAGEIKTNYGWPCIMGESICKTFDPIQKKIVPWTARWYQVEMLRDKSLKSVSMRSSNG